ncbi:MAG TPA: mannose-6-phosphate isomerase [Bacteroidales bacterium]|nr:mannose-6-phosphate isomerase [Bacteroidales bacterium]
MNELYPLKFKPVFDDRIWGGEKIRTHLGLDFAPLNRCAEAWILSGYEGKQTVVSNGFLEGNEINELIEIYMDDLVGEKVYENTGETFPLLVKFIDSRDWLSVQVHPDDELAQKSGMPNGKTEMWYVIDAEENAQLIAGFNRKITQKQFLEHLHNKTLPEILNYETVRKDDAIFMPAGRIHSLGPGVLLAEIQQTSDATYRLFDWHRKDSQGKERELHTELALAAIDFDAFSDNKTNYKPRLNETVDLVSCPYFTTNLIELAQPLRKNYEEIDSFVVYVCLEGAMRIKCGDSPTTVAKGEVVLIPAMFDVVEIYPDGNVKFLEVYI